MEAHLGSEGGEAASLCPQAGPEYTEAALGSQEEEMRGWVPSMDVLHQADSSPTLGLG